MHKRRGFMIALTVGALGVGCSNRDPLESISCYDCLQKGNCGDMTDTCLVRLNREEAAPEAPAEPEEEPVAESVIETAVETATEPVAEPVTEPVPVIQPAPEPIPAPEPEPEIAPTPAEPPPPADVAQAWFENDVLAACTLPVRFPITVENTTDSARTNVPVIVTGADLVAMNRAVVLRDIDIHKLYVVDPLAPSGANEYNGQLLPSTFVDMRGNDGVFDSRDYVRFAVPRLEAYEQRLIYLYDPPVQSPDRMSWDEAPLKLEAPAATGVSTGSPRHEDGPFLFEDPEGALHVIGQSYPDSGSLYHAVLPDGRSPSFTQLRLPGVVAVASYGFQAMMDAKMDADGNLSLVIGNALLGTLGKWQYWRYNHATGSWSHPVDFDAVPPNPTPSSCFASGNINPLVLIDGRSRVHVFVPECRRKVGYWTKSALRHYLAPDGFSFVPMGTHVPGSASADDGFVSHAQVDAAHGRGWTKGLIDAGGSIHLLWTDGQSMSAHFYYQRAWPTQSGSYTWLTVPKTFDAGNRDTNVAPGEMSEPGIVLDSDGLLHVVHGVADGTAGEYVTGQIVDEQCTDALDALKTTGPNLTWTRVSLGDGFAPYSYKGTSDSNPPAYASRLVARADRQGKVYAFWTSPYHRNAYFSAWEPYPFTLEQRWSYAVVLPLYRTVDGSNDRVMSADVAMEVDASNRVHLLHTAEMDCGNGWCFGSSVVHRLRRLDGSWLDQGSALPGSLASSYILSKASPMLTQLSLLPDYQNGDVLASWVNVTSAGVGHTYLTRGTSAQNFFVTIWNDDVGFSMVHEDITLWSLADGTVACQGTTGAWGGFTCVIPNGAYELHVMDDFRIVRIDGPTELVLYVEDEIRWEIGGREAVLGCP